MYMYTLLNMHIYKYILFLYSKPQRDSIQMQLCLYVHVHVLTTIPRTFPHYQSICSRGQHCPSTDLPSQSQVYHPTHLSVHNKEENGLTEAHHIISMSIASQYPRVYMYTVTSLIPRHPDLFSRALKRLGCLGTRLHCNTVVLFF